MPLEFETCDVFTDTRFGGNPLAVVHGAEALDGPAMQRVAREFNLSETVFVLPADSPGAEARLRIFTPSEELPFAGHPNVGTAVLLARRRGIAADRLALDQPAGRVLARLGRDPAGLVASAEITAPQPFATHGALDAAAVAACATLPAAAIRSTLHAPLLCGCGTVKAVAEVADTAALAAAAPDLAAFRAQLPAGLTSGLLLHAEAAPGERRVRFFAPLVGIIEDPATGSAAVALAGLLASLGERLDWALRQGIEMGRPSLLRTRAWREGEAIRAAVGGAVVPVSRGVIDVEA